MGKRGPKPTPTRILQGRGSWRAKSRGPEPTVPEGVPEIPPGLREDAAEVWETVTAQLQEMGILGRCDGNALERYCNAIMKYRECEEILEKEGVTYERYNLNGDVLVKERPEVKIAAKLSEECRKLENAFGLNPSARTGLCVTKPSDTKENRGKRKNKGRFFNAAAG